MLSRTASRPTSGRFLRQIRQLSKKDESHEVLPVPVVPKRRINPLIKVKARSDKSKPKKDTKASEPREYIPLGQFPKAPESVINQLLKQLYEGMGMEAPAQDDVPPGEQKLINFEIPDKYLKSQIRAQITDKDRAVVEEIDNLARANDEKEINQLHMSVLKLYYDEDTNSFQPVPEHALKKSLSGMINLNPHMDDIDDEYLWELFPKNGFFGTPPFETSPGRLDGFKTWEQEQLAKLQKKQKVKQDHQREYHEFQLMLNNSKSFFQKPLRQGGRKKLDRQLLKKYKLLKKDGKLPDDE